MAMLRIYRRREGEKDVPRWTTECVRDSLADKCPTACVTRVLRGACMAVAKEYSIMKAIVIGATGAVGVQIITGQDIRHYMR